MSKYTTGSDFRADQGIGTNPTVIERDDVNGSNPTAITRLGNGTAPTAQGVGNNPTAIENAEGSANVCQALMAA